MYRLILYLGILCSLSLHAQTDNPYNPSVIRHEIEGLNVTASVLYIAAHPDDENTRLISYLTKERNYRTAYLSLTMGDGGQNLIGDEQGIELGILRTQELLSARRIDGAEQFFSRAYDFGYSKTPEETFAKWGREEILKDVVTIIRYFKPDIIITRFPTTGEGGHGHHTASAILAGEAFDLAANPQYKDHLDQKPWRTTRLLWNTFNFPGISTPVDSSLLKLEVNGYNKLLGRSYGEIAAEARSQHRSQGFGSAKNRAPQYEYFKYIKGDKPEKDIMEDIKPGWERFVIPAYGQQPGAILNKEIPALLSEDNQEKLIKGLWNVHELLNRFSGSDAAMVDRYKLRIEMIIAHILGIYQESVTANKIIVQDSKVKFKQVFNYRGESHTATLNVFAGLNKSAVGGNLVYAMKDVVNADTSLRYLQNPVYPVSNPYTLKRNAIFDRFELENFNELLSPQAGSLYPLYTEVMIDSVKMLLRSNEALRYKFVDPSEGERFEPVCLTYPVTLRVKNENVILSKTKSTLVEVEIKNHTQDTLKGKMRLALTPGTEPYAVEIPVTLLPGELKTQTATIDVSALPETSKEAWLFSQVVIGESVYMHEMREIRYAHIPTQYYHRSEPTKVLVLELSNKVKQIGYIPGAGDKVAECLRQLGYQVTELTDERLASENLDRYEVIISGVRAFNTNEKLTSLHAKLMNYVQDGGRMIVQYNTNSRIGPTVAPIGPYPFTISRNRVTDENATVSFTDSSSFFLNSPYKITADDFKGWIQERGIYFVSDRDKNYRTLFSMADPGEQAADGSLIWCNYGKGTFIYTGLAFFRELPYGAPGAYRLMMNLIESKPKK